MKQILLSLSLSLFAASSLFAQSTSCPTGSCTAPYTFSAGSSSININPSTVTDVCLVGPTTPGDTAFLTGTLDNIGVLTIYGNIVLDVNTGYSSPGIFVSNNSFSTAQELVVYDTVRIKNINIQANSSTFVQEHAYLILDNTNAKSSSTDITIASFASVRISGSDYKSATTSIATTGHTISVTTCGNFVALPINLDYIRAVGNTVSFQLASFQNVANISLQYSKDGQHWDYYSEAQLNTWEQAYYYCPAGFYRIKEVALSGEVSYSTIVKVLPQEEQQNALDPRLGRYNILGQRVR
ncbi:MAG: hypothetical protein JST06_09700 [Bacteroidetes bacterium]|nr:hypothetical protein [Bacteroidota bacterium]